MYGKLYNWYAVNDDRGLAPEGWHIPSDSEWTILTDFLGDEQNVALKLKSKSGWIDNGNGNNQSNFSGLPTGLIYVECKGGDSEQGFYGLNKIGLWWTSSEYDADWLGNYTAWSRSLTFEDNSLNKLHYCKIAGLAVRCLKN
jgi:uncharacterized protein (TIGR02145 family)